MATYKTVDADSLDADLLAVANTIRTKGGTSGSLAFPTGFQSAIQAIQTGHDVSGVTAVAGDVVSGKKFVTSSGVLTTGTLTVANYYYGASDPAASLGVNGDLYFKMEG